MRRGVGLLRVRAGYPQIASAALSALVVREPADCQCANFCALRGFHAQLDVGITAATLSAGYASIDARRRLGWPFATAVFLGYGLRAALMRSYAPSSLVPPVATYGGVEGSFSIAHVSFTLGCLRRLDSGEGGHWLWTGGIGWGF